MLDGIEKTASETIVLVNNIKTLMQEYKLLIRSKYVKMYSQDLLNNLFKYPYTKIEFIQSDLHVSRNTAIRYLEELVKAGILIKHKIGRDNFYENKALFKLLSKGSLGVGFTFASSIDKSVHNNLITIKSWLTCELAHAYITKLRLHIIIPTVFGTVIK
jgi:hypothetical protein